MILVGVGLVCLAIGITLYVRGLVVLRQNQIELRRHPLSPEFAILIPARFESSVIEGLFEGLKEQTVRVTPKNVFVIVESLQDPTVKIAKRYGYKVIVRERIAGRERKGYALDEAIKQILLTRRFDLYFIFDADNILAADYLERMLDAYAAGYEIVTGYRDIKNRQPNVFATVSSLTFSMINAVGNRQRIKYGANVVFSGTGCFVSGDLVDEWQGWPFHSLTEDYELSLYAAYKQLPTLYNEWARFYDEQPTSFMQTFHQRVRWIRGYFDARRQYIPLMKKKIKKQRFVGKKYQNCTNVLIQRYDEKWRFGSIKREIIGIKPVIWLIVAIVLILLGILVQAFYAQGLIETLLTVLLMLLAIYVFLALATAYILKREDLTLLAEAKVKAILFNPLYLVTYIPCAMKAILAKKVEWTKIEHKENEDISKN